MVDRTELLEAALGNFPEGIALAALDDTVVFWNRAAEAITGYSAVKLIGTRVHESLDALVVGGAQGWTNQARTSNRRSLVYVRHQAGHMLRITARVRMLRDGLGKRIGTGLIFHSAESMSASPHEQVISEDPQAESSQADLEDRLEALYEDFRLGLTPLGVLWITVDQAPELRRTHGAKACEVMLEKLERTIANGLKTSEEIARWADDEFLVASHEPNAAALVTRAQMIVGVARTTDFRWWGDRVSLTVSIGAAVAQQTETLARLLERAQTQAHANVREGGNRATGGQERQTCSPF